MSETPGDQPENPFEGTPFEQLFRGATGGAGGLDFGQLFAQMQSLMQPYDGPLNWDVALDIARKTSSAGGDPSPTQRQKDAVADAVRLADHWLDDTTTFPSGIVTATAWSKAEWLVNTLEVWKVLVEPVAQSSVDAMSGQLGNGVDLPPELAGMAGMLGPMQGFLGKAIGALYAHQAGSGLGALAGEVLSVSDVGVPLAPAGKAALLPANIAGFADGLGVSEDDVLLFLALREAAHQRLFAGVPWLRDHVTGAVRDYAAGVEINIESIQQRMEEQMRGVDLNNPEALQELMQSGMFEVPTSPQQKAALERLEIVLALVEGWVDEVVAQATATRMPAATKLAEAVRRRRASGGPAEQTFATLVGLELRPRRLRDASTLWGSLRSRQGIEGRDGVWMSPALLPTSADLDDPLGFREGSDLPAGETDLDAELAKLLGGDPGSGSSSPSDPADPE